MHTVHEVGTDHDTCPPLPRLAVDRHHVLRVRVQVPFAREKGGVAEIGEYHRGGGDQMYVPVLSASAEKDFLEFFFFFSPPNKPFSSCIILVNVLVDVAAEGKEEVHGRWVVVVERISEKKRRKGEKRKRERREVSTRQVSTIDALLGET